MEKNKLEQYTALVKEVPMLNRKLDRLYEKKQTIPTVRGKVQASSREFPYIETHVEVLMDEPKEAERIMEQIQINEKRLEQAEMLKAEIEMFIADIEDAKDRLIFECVYLKGMKMKEVAAMLGYSKGRVSQRISKTLESLNRLNQV